MKLYQHPTDNTQPIINLERVAAVSFWASSSRVVFYTEGGGDVAWNFTESEFLTRWEKIMEDLCDQDNWYNADRTKFGVINFNLVSSIRKSLHSVYIEAGGHEVVWDTGAYEAWEDLMDWLPLNK